MREIKFRAYSKSLKAISEVSAINWDTIMNNPQPSIEYKDFPCTRYDLADAELMMFTGLKDKNGKEIYEGDIILIPDDYDKYGWMAGGKRDVYFLDGCFRLKPKRDIKDRGHTIDDDMEFCKIIGNIYENPELIL